MDLAVDNGLGPSPRSLNGYKREAVSDPICKKIKMKLAVLLVSSVLAVAYAPTPTPTPTRAAPVATSTAYTSPNGGNGGNGGSDGKTNSGPGSTSGAETVGVSAAAFLLALL